MQYNFDEVIDRSGTNAFKIDAMKARIGKEGLLPLWVADMDFKAAPEIIEALQNRVQHGVFGYTLPTESYYQSIIDWVKKLYDWDVSKEEISYLPGIVKGIAFAIDCCTNEGDKIIIQPPVYHPFRIVPQAHKREVVENPLIFDGEKYRMNLDGLRKIAETKECKMLILCNPHNPIGLAWDKAILEELAEICHDNNILVISDEIHAEIIHQNKKHIPFATVSAKAEKNSITLMAPSKTFNLAGIVTSYAIVKDRTLRLQYYNYLKRSDLDQGTLFAYLATETAYTKAENWRIAMIEYIWENICYVDNYLKQNIPSIKAVIPEASFLIWLDCTSLHLSTVELKNLFVEKAGLALNDGETFGSQGKGFMRLNVGCSRNLLEQAMQQLKDAVNSL